MYPHGDSNLTQQENEVALVPCKRVVWTILWTNRNLRSTSQGTKGIATYIPDKESCLALGTPYWVQTETETGS